MLNKKIKILMYCACLVSLCSFKTLAMEEKISSALKKYPNIAIADVEIPLKKGKSKHYHIAWYEVQKNLQKGSIKTEAIGWLNNLRKTVSGNPRVYLDNTLKMVLNKEETTSTTPPRSPDQVETI